MLKHEGNRIGDAWFYVDQDVVHAYYLTCPLEVPAHVQWDIGHATSRDLVNWEVHDLALLRGEKGSWDAGLATGSILKWQDRFWMAYTGQRTQQVGLAVSDDLFTWEKLPQNPVTAIDTRYYEAIGSGARQQPHWRDPFLFEHDGWVYQAVCASRNDGPEDARGTLGLARTQNMTDWEVLPPPELEPIAQELECPQLIEENGTWYLAVSSGPEWFSGEFRNRKDGRYERFTSYSMVAPSPFGPFRVHGNGRILPDTGSRQPYACQVVCFRGQNWLLGTTIEGICDPIRVVFTPAGIRH